MYIDTHAHIYDPKFDADRPEIIQHCIENGVGKILMPNCDSTTIPAMEHCVQQYPEVCIPMMGLHPCYVTELYNYELDMVYKKLEQNKYCAIGEIGLDYYWDTTYVQEQKQALIAQIELALHYQLAIVIHSRESTQDCMDIIKPYIAKGLKGVFHCYSGTLHQAQELCSWGFYLGIGGVLTYKKSGLDAIVAQIDITHLILETDAPYLAPVPHRSHRNSPHYIPIIAQQLSDIKALPLQQIADITTQNTLKLFRL
jgi:TatD DNase family protein